MPKYDLIIDPPLMNSAGSLGFAPDPHGPLDLSLAGAFVTNPISITSRKAARGTRLLENPGGFLMHSGLPNPGLSSILRRYGKRWDNSEVPIIPHIIFQHAAQLNEMISRIEGLQGVGGIELGLPPHVDGNMVHEILGSMICELPVIIRLPLDRIPALVPELEDQLLSTISAVSIGPPRGALPGHDGSLVHGRMYGPGLFPLTLAAMGTLAETELPVIPGVGVYDPHQVDLLLEAGAAAVQLDTVLWRGKWPPPGI